MAILSIGAGRILVEMVGGAVLEVIVLPVRGAYRRFVPQPAQDMFSRTVGGPWRLLAILVTVVFAALGLSAWLTR